MLIYTLFCDYIFCNVCDPNDGGHFDKRFFEIDPGWALMPFTVFNSIEKQSLYSYVSGGVLSGQVPAVFFAPCPLKL